MTLLNKRHSNTRGFTIIELMIAISVFSVVLLICISAIIYVGRLYYLGISKARSQEVARTSMDTITDSIKFSAESVSIVGADSNWDGAYCIGTRKYSYKLGKVLVDTTPQTNQTTEALVESIDPSCGTVGVVATPYISADPDATPTKELLGKFMRLNEFTIIPNASTGLATVKISIVYGGDGSPSDSEIFNIESGKIVSCKTGVGGSQFCAIITLEKTVFGV
jgi:prepilin-type N-terminal cleavage/methylation domain-containing protein